MKMVRLFIIVLISFALIIDAIHALAGDKAADLGSITIRGGSSISAGTTIETFDREALESVEADSVADFLSRLPSVEVTTGRRGEQLVRLRGFDQTEILFLIDGVPSAVPYDGAVDPGKIPLAMIEKIEIIKGAGPVTYGPGGLGGAINLITRSPADAPLFAAAIDGSPIHQIRANLLHGRSLGSFRYVVFGGFQEQANFPLSDDFKTTSNQSKVDRIGSSRRNGFGGTKLEYEINDDHLLSLLGNAIGGIYKIPPSTLSARPSYWKFDPWLAATVAASHRGTYAGENVAVTETAFYSPFINTLKSYDNSNYNTQTGRSTFTSHFSDLSAGGFIKVDASVSPKFMEGIDFALWTGARFEKHDERQDGTAGTTTYSHWLLTSAPQITFHLGSNAELRTGVQIDAEVPEKFAGIISPANNITASPSASLYIAASEKVDLEASFARRARFPTLKERFADAFAERVPNPNLGAEKAWHMALDSTVHITSSLDFKLGLFNSEVNDLIIRQLLGGGQYQLQNASEARLAGVEALVSLDYKPWRLKADIGYEYLYARRLNTPAQDSRLEYRPAHKGNIFVEWRPIKRLSLSSDLFVTGPRPYQDLDTSTWGSLRTNVNWSISVKGEVLKWLELSLSATNILDRNNMSEYGFPEPGRMIWAAAKISL